MHICNAMQCIYICIYAYIYAYMQKKVQRGVIYLLASFANSLAWICLQQKLYSEAAIALRKMSTVAFLQNISVNCYQQTLQLQMYRKYSYSFSHLAGLILTRPTPFLASYSPSNQKKSPSFANVKSYSHLLFFCFHLNSVQQHHHHRHRQSKITNINKHHLVDLSPCTENTLNSVSRMGNL